MDTILESTFWMVSLTISTDDLVTVTATGKVSAWASCQIRKVAGAHAPGMPGTFSPSPQVSDPDMHHGTWVTHVPWCMPGSPTSGFLWNRRRGGNVPGIPGACATCNFTYLVRGPLGWPHPLEVCEALTLFRHSYWDYWRSYIFKHDIANNKLHTLVTRTTHNNGFQDKVSIIKCSINDLSFFLSTWYGLCIGMSIRP